jgi:hypothetical protein
MYPSDESVSEISVTLRNDESLIFDIKTDIQYRRLALTAAMAAAREIT